MAISKDDLLISISADSKEAVKGLQDIQKGMKGLSDSAAGTHKALTGFGAASLAVNESMELLKGAFETVHKVWEATVGKFQEGEDNLRRLGNTLSIMGDKDVAGTVDEFRKFTKELNENSTVSEETSIKLLQLATASGATKDQAKKLVETAANVSAAFGRPVQEVFENLKGSLKGVGRGVAEFAPELRGMDEQSLKSGKAIDYLNQKMSGFAKGELQTVGGQAKAAANVIEEAFKSIGESIATGLDLGSAQDGLLKLAKSLKQLADDAAPVIVALTGAIKALVAQITDGLIVAFEASMTPIRAVMNGFEDLKAAASGDFSFKNLREQATTTAGVVVQAFSDMDDQASGTIGKASNLDEALDKLGKTAKTVKTPSFLSADAKKMLEELTKLTDELAKKSMMAGASEADKARVEGAADFLRIAQMEKKLKLAGALTTVAKQQIADARTNAAAEITNKLDEIRKKNLDEIVAKTLDLAKAVSEDGATELEKIQMEYEAQLNILQVQQDKLMLEKDLNAEAIQAIEAQKVLLGLRKDQAKAKAPGQEFDQTLKAGQAVAQDITQTFQSGAMGLAMGAAGAVSAIVDAIQALVDFIPGIINKVAGLLDSITELPLKVGDAIAHLLGSIVGLIANLVPNLFKMVEKIIDSLDSFMDKLPDAIVSVINKLPSLITHLVDKLPTFIAKFVRLIITYWPRIIGAAISFVIKGIPMIVKELVKVVVTELPPALRDAFVSAIKEAINALKNGFKGVSPIDMSQIGNGIKQIGSSIQQQSSKLFAVVDAAASARGLDAADKMATALQSSMNYIFNLWKQIMAALRALWQWVYDSLRAVWQWIWDHIFQPIISALTVVWQWVWDHIMSPIISALRSVWQWIWDHVLSPFVPAFQAVGDFLKWVFETFTKSLQAVGDFLKWIFETFTKSFQAVGDFLKPVFDAFVSALQPIANTFKSASGSLGGGGGGILGTGLHLASGGPVYAAGGAFFKSRGNDRIPIMGEDGEFMINRRAVARIGVDNLAAMNQSGQIPGGGGANISVGGITIENHGDKVDETFIRTKVMPTFFKELKRATVDGRFVMSSKGLRDV